jgi:phosphoglycerate dehydrogenase-like enzyme
MPQRESETVVLCEQPGAGRLATAIRERLPELDVGIVDPASASTADLRDVRILLTESPPSNLALLNGAPRWVHALTAGVDGDDLDALAERGVILTNASGVAAEPAAEQVLAYLLAFERRLHRGIRQQERGEWEWYGGRELIDETVGVVGVGAIGSRVAELCSALGVEVLGCSRDPDSVPVVDEAYGTDDLEAMLARTDFLVLTCPLTPATRGLIGATELATLPDHAVLVNVSRGALVDEAALVTALRDDVVRGAALDVFETEPLPPDSPLWDRDDVILTPHNAGSTPHYWTRNAALFARNYRRFTDGDRDALVNRVV